MNLYEHQVSMDAPAGARPAPAVAALAAASLLPRMIKWALLAAIGLAPVLFLPAANDTLLAKVIVIEILAVVAFALWLFEVLASRVISYKRSPLNAAMAVLLAVLIAAMAFSSSPWASFWGSDITGEKVATFLAFAAFSFLVSATFRRDDVVLGLIVLLVSLSILGGYTILGVIVAAFADSVPWWLSVNSIGTTNALAYVLAIGTMLSLGVVLARTTSAGRVLRSGRMGILAGAAFLLTFIPLLAIGFRFVWIGLAATFLMWIIVNFLRPIGELDGEPEYPLGTPSLAVIAFLLIASVFFSWRGVPLVSRLYQPPLEISPAVGATLSIGRATISDRPILGFGPANFRLAFNRFRDPALNQTPFWTARFNHGFSFLTTALSTVGVLGVLALLAFVAVAAIVIIRAFLAAAGGDPLLFGIGGAAIFVLLMWFLYAGNFTASFILFVLLGMLNAVSQDSGAAGGRLAMWFRLVRRSITIRAPALNFVVSLAVVFGLAASIAAVYGLVAQYVAEVFSRRAALAVSGDNDFDTARALLARAATLNPGSDAYPAGQAQLGLITIQQLIQQASTDPQNQEIAARFRASFSDAVTAAQRAIAFGAEEPNHWLALGALYEAVVAFVSGAPEAALDAYQRAAEVDPWNPAIPFLRGRVYFTQAEILTLQVYQTASGEERSQIEAARNEALRHAKEELERSIGLKSDYAQAHFLLAQIAIRENNLQEAIRRTEQTVIAAPQDIGVHFQLGVLYYRAGNLDAAKRSFENAILLNDNYSNARYFLGLIWDQKGDKDAALSQFMKIQRLNPDNEEVARIISNLESGKPALEGIVPPNPAPEARKEAPVREESSNSTIRR